MAPTFGNAAASVSKREKFSWAESCSPGKFTYISKYDLNIDGTYQREEVSKAKVMEIVREWDWKLFGTISVIQRADGTYWVYEGGHRTRASFFRDDVMQLPCMVFQSDSKKTEARAFIGANTMKSVVSAYHIHRAAVKTEEPIAVAVQSILDKYGYFPTQGTSKKHAFKAINTLHKLVKEDRLLAEKVFAACASIAQDGEPISGEVLDAVFTCQKKMEGKVDILSNGYLERMKLETLPGIESAIRREKHIVGRGGATISAKALLDVLNKGKKRKLTWG